MPLFKCRQRQPTAEDVEREIQMAIDAAWKSAQQDTDVIAR